MDEGAVVPSRIVKWTRPPTYGAPPPARGQHSGVVVGNLFIVFGGTAYETAGRFKYFSDVWALDITSMRWHEPRVAGRGPAARAGAGACVVGNCVYIFGGRGESGLLFNDMWCLDVEAWSWRHVPSASAAPPSARYGHVQLSIGDRVFVFGGTDGKTCNNEVWLFDTRALTWIKPRLTGTPPTPRQFATGCYDQSTGRVIVTCGASFSKDGAGFDYQSDAKILDFTSLSWLRARVSGEVPTAKYQAAIALVGNVAVLSGGWQGPRASSSSSSSPGSSSGGSGGKASAAGRSAGGGLGSTSKSAFGSTGGSSATSSSSSHGKTGGGAGGSSSATAEDKQQPTIEIPWTSGMGHAFQTDPSALIRVPYSQHRDTSFLDLEPDLTGGNPDVVAEPDPSALEWVRPMIAGTAPGYRYGAVSAASGACVLYFGGWEDNRPCNDVYCLDLTDLVMGGGDDGSGGGGEMADEGGYEQAGSDQHQQQQQQQYAQYGNQQQQHEQYEGRSGGGGVGGVSGTPEW